MKPHHRFLIPCTLLTATILLFHTNFALFAQSITGEIPLPLVGVPNNLGTEVYVSGAQITNTSSEAATLTLTAYDADGTIDGQSTIAIAENGSITLFPLVPIDSMSAQTLRLSSDSELATIINVLTNDFDSGASIVPSQLSTEIRLPLLCKCDYGTVIGIHNTNDTAATVAIVYSDGINRDETIPARAVRFYSQNFEDHTTAVFAGTITSDIPVSAAVLQTDSIVSFAYSGFANTSVAPIFPLINVGGSGYVTGVQIQNAGTESTEVTLTYNPSLSGTSCAETQTISAGESATFALSALVDGSNSNCAGGERFVGSASVTSNSTDQPLVGIANQLLPSVNGEAYGSFRVEDATDTVVLPLVMDRNNGFFTGFNIANVGSTATDVVCTFTESSYTVTGTIPANGALTDIQNDKIADGYVGSATCIGDTDAKLVAVVNQLGPSSTADQFLVYEGTNK